jgi:hypothetical protein
MNTATVTSAIIKIFSAHGQHGVRRAHDQRVTVEQHRQHDRDRGRFHQHADEHLEPADRDDPAEPGMRAHDQEERPCHQQQQEAQLEHDQRQRDQQDEQPGHQGREHRGERDLQPGGPLVALEQRVDGRVLLLHGAGDAAVGGLLGLDQRGARRLVRRDRLRPQQLTAVLVDHGLLAARVGRVRGAAQIPVQPRLAHQHRPQLVGVLVD